MLVGGALVVLTALGMKRFDVSWWGKAGTFALMVSFPAFLLADADVAVSGFMRVVAWGFGLPGLVLSYYAAITYVPLMRRNLAAGRAAAEGGRVKAVIMAGGEGTRLRPLTSNAPKPMLPIANRPMMEHVIHLLRRHGFDGSS